MQAKSVYGGSIFSESHFFATALAASKNGAHFKIGQNKLNKTILATKIQIRETQCTRRICHMQNFKQICYMSEL